MKKICDVPYDDTLKISEESKVVYASSFGVGGSEDELRVIVCDKKLISNGDEFKLINASDLQIIMDKQTACDLKNLLEQYIE